MKSIDVRSDSCAEYNFDSNEKYPEFKIGYHVRVHNVNTPLLKDIILIGLKNFL